MISLILELQLSLAMLQLIPLDVLPPTPSPTNGVVYAPRSNGIAASLIGGFFGIGILVVVAILMGTKPRRRINGR